MNLQNRTHTHTYAYALALLSLQAALNYPHTTSHPETYFTEMPTAVKVTK